MCIWLKYSLLDIGRVLFLRFYGRYVKIGVSRVTSLISRKKFAIIINSVANSCTRVITLYKGKDFRGIRCFWPIHTTFPVHQFPYSH